MFVGGFSDYFGDGGIFAGCGFLVMIVSIEDEGLR
jgi:hypothetical protein